MMKLTGVMSLIYILFSLMNSTAQADGALTVKQIAQPGFASVNSWLLESKEGVVVIDAQRVLSAGQSVVDAIRETNKPLQAVIITHPHPDHFGGLASILEAFPDTPVYASEHTQQVIATDSNGYQKATQEVVPDDSPEIFPAPDRTFSDGDTLRIGTIELRIDEIGAGESETMTMLYAPAKNALFVGDLVAHRMTGFVLEGRSKKWIQQIKNVIDEYGEHRPRIFPGHGQAGEFDALLKGQLQWLTDLRKMVEAKLDDERITDKEVEEIESAFTEKYKGYPIVAEIPPLMSLNIRAIAKELLTKD